VTFWSAKWLTVFGNRIMLIAWMRLERPELIMPLSYIRNLLGRRLSEKQSRVYRDNYIRQCRIPSRSHAKSNSKNRKNADKFKYISFLTSTLPSDCEGLCWYILPFGLKRAFPPVMHHKLRALPPYVLSNYCKSHPQW
jgi:hypothetical protein